MLAQRLPRLGHSVRSFLPSATLLSGFFRAFVLGREGGDIRRDSRMETPVGKQRVDDLMANRKDVRKLWATRTYSPLTIHENL